MQAMRRAGCGLLGCFILAAASALGQATGPQPMGTSPDLFDNLVAAGASFDMDSPVEAQAEFDPATAAPGARVIYRITISALDESLEVPDHPPAPEGFALRPGGRAQSYVPTIGRKVRPQTTLLFHAIAPGTNGQIIIPSFKAMAYGKAVDVPAATLTVSADGATAPQSPALFVIVPAADVYVGETVTLTVAVPRPLDNTVLGVTEPHIKGEFIFSEDVPALVRPQENIQHDGQSFLAFAADVVLTPLREGPRELIGQANCIGIRPPPGQGIVNQLVDSDPVTLMVHALPTNGQLAGFTGAVGQFQLDPPRLSANVVRAGEPLVVNITLRSAANIGHLTPPPPPNATGWQSFPPQPDNAPATIPEQRNFESFNYTLIPTSDQIKATPPIPFSYFDPGQKTYVDLTIPSMPITVTPAPVAAAEPPMPTNAPLVDTNDSAGEKELAFMGLTASPGRTASSLGPLEHRGWFYAVQIIPACLLGGLWAWDRRRRHLREHPEILRKRRARRGLRRQLRLARRAAAAQDAAAFAQGAAGALREACAPHGAADPAALVCADVLQELPADEQHGRAGEAVRRLFAAADAQRFGGRPQDSSALLSLQPDLEQLLEQLKTRL